MNRKNMLFLNRLFHQFLLTAVCYLLNLNTGNAQSSPSLAERLGYPAGTKLLILHADDLGMSPIGKSG